MVVVRCLYGGWGNFRAVWTPGKMTKKKSNQKKATKKKPKKSQKKPMVRLHVKWLTRKRTALNQRGNEQRFFKTSGAVATFRVEELRKRRGIQQYFSPLLVYRYQRLFTSRPRIPRKMNITLASFAFTNQTTVLIFRDIRNFVWLAQPRNERLLQHAKIKPKELERAASATKYYRRSNAKSHTR